MLYYANWVLTKAQFELIVSDVAVVDYDYGKEKKKRKKGEFDNTKADSAAVRKAGDEWLARYGEGKDAGKGISVGDIFGSGKKVKSGAGVNID